MSERLVTERELRELLRELRTLKQCVAAIEVVETIAYTPPTSYTPTYLGGTTAGVTTYSLQQGQYIRLGNVVLVTGNVTWTASTGTGNAQVSLPFTPTFRGAGALWVQNVTFANGTPQIQIAAQNFFLMYSPLTNAAGAIVQMEAAGDVRFTCVLFL